MNNNLELNKKEGTVFYQSIMSLISIIIFTIGVSLVTGIILQLFTKVIGLDTSVKFQELLENEILIPDYFSNVICYSICRILLGAISIPIVFFLAIKDRFKGSYMNLVDLKKFKIILCIYTALFTFIFGFYYYRLYTDAVNKYVKYNAIIKENNADEKGYFNDGVKKVGILPTVVLIAFPIGGLVGEYVTVATVTSKNREYLNKLISANQMQYYVDNNLQSGEQSFVAQNNILK